MLQESNGSRDDFNKGKAPSSNAHGHPRTYIDPQAPLNNKKKISTIRQALKNIGYADTDPLYNQTKINNKGLSESISPSDWKKAMKDTEIEAEDMVVKDWAEFTPTVCNSGFCDIFALKINKYLKGATLWETEESDGGKTFGHVWIEYKGKYYDAEIPKGVKDLKDIPYIKRAIEFNGKMPEVNKY